MQPFLLDSFTGDMFKGLDELMTNGFLNFTTVSELHTQIKASYKIPTAPTACFTEIKVDLAMDVRITRRLDQTTPHFVNCSRVGIVMDLYKRDLANNSVHPDRSGVSSHAHQSKISCSKWTFQF